MLFTRFLRGALAGRFLAALLVALQALAAQAQTGSTPLIWEARSPTNVVYLFGTIHVGGRAIYPLSAPVERAYAASRVVALEADPTNQSAALAAMRGAVYAPPDNLANHVSPELMALLEKTLPDIGLPIEYARVMRPHLLALMLAMLEVGRQGYDPSLGLDVHFARRAKQDGKRIVELESIRGQIALLDGFSPELQEGMLRSAIEGISAGSLGTDVRELVEAWSTGNAERLMRQVDKEMDGLPAAQAKEMRELVYDSRNRAMTDMIVTMLAGEEPVFVALGAGHLLGDAGIVELLRRKGYAVKQL